MLLVLTVLAIAEAYGLTEAGGIRALAQQRPAALLPAIQAYASWMNQRYGAIIPDGWLDDQAQAALIEPAAMVQWVRALAAQLQQATLQAELLGQVYESLIEPLAFAQRPMIVQQGLGTPNTESVHAPEAGLRARAIAPHRKRQGAYYTPAALVNHMVAQTVGDRLRSGRTNLRILDPACGGGIFLLVAYRYLRAQQPDLGLIERQRLLQNSIAGVDLDQWAVDVTRLSLHLELLRGVDLSKLDGAKLDGASGAIASTLGCIIRPGNALIQADLGETQISFGGTHLPLLLSNADKFRWQSAFPEAIAAGGFDVVIGNPPYLDSEAMTVWLPHWRRYCTQHYQAARGNWDLFCVFIEQALKLCKPGGLHSFVVPNKLLSAAYAAGVRSLLTQHSHIKLIRDYSQSEVFDAAVYPLVYVAERRSTSFAQDLLEQSQPCTPVCFEQMGPGSISGPQRTDSIDYRQLLAPSGWVIEVNAARAAIFEAIGDRFPPLESVAQVSGAATVAEAYRLKSLIFSLKDESKQSREPHQASEFASLLRVVNSGTLDRYCIRWANKPLRYLGDRISQPVVSSLALQQHLPQRYRQARATKLIVASMTRQLECVADLQGELLAGKSTCIIWASRVPLLYLLGLLNSRLMTRLFCQRFWGNSLKGGYLRVGPAQLRQLPIPPLTTAHEQTLGDRLIALVQARCLRGAAYAPLISAASPAPETSEHALEPAIDQIVYRLYGLDPNDIAQLEPE